MLDWLVWGKFYIKVDGQLLTKFGDHKKVFMLYVNNLIHAMLVSPMSLFIVHILVRMLAFYVGGWGVKHACTILTHWDAVCYE